MLYRSVNIIRRCLVAAVEVVVKQNTSLYNTGKQSDLPGCISHMAAADNQLN